MRSPADKTDGKAPMSALMVPVMRRLYPLTSVVLSRVLGRRPLEAVAARVTEIAPAGTSRMPGILMLEEDRAAVTAAQHETTIAHEWERVAGRTGTHRATRRFELRDALVTPAGVFTARDVFHKVGPAGPRGARRPRPPEVERGCFPSSQTAGRYFGHWVRDMLPTTYLREPDETLHVHAPAAWGHAQGYLDLMGLERSPDDVFYRRLALFDDVGMNASRRMRLARLKADIRRRLPDGPRRRIFLSRGASGSARSLANETALTARLAAEGFAVLDVSQPLGVLLDALGSARTVVSMEGSHCAHAMMAAPRDWTFVTINPADRFNNNQADYMPSIGGRLATTVAERRADGYHVDPDRLMRLVDLAEGAARYLGEEGSDGAAEDARHA